MKVKEPRLLISELALLLYVFLIPIEDFFLQDIIGSSSRIAAGLMILVYLFMRPGFNWRISPNYFYLYFIWASLSIVVWANTPDYYSIFRLFMWMLTTVVVANIIKHNVSLISLVFKTYILSCIYLVCVAIINFMGNSAIGIERVNVEGMNENLLASQFLICIVYLLYNYFKIDMTLRMKVFILGLIFFFLLGIIASGSRSALLSVFISFLLLSSRNYFRLTNVVQLFVVVLIGFVFFTSDNNFTQLLGERITSAVTDKGSSRLLIWTVAIPMIIDNPILGVGYRNFPTEFGNYLGVSTLDLAETLKFSEFRTVGTHNAIIETLSELGLIGLLFFYGFQFKLFRKLNANKLNDSLLLFVILIAISINSLFGDLANLKYFWLMVAMGFGFISSKNMNIA